MNSLKYIISIIVIFTLIIACSSRKDNQQNNKQNQTQPPKDTSKPDPKTQYRDIEYFEEENNKSQLIDLRYGPVTFDMVFEGTGSFKVTISDSLAHYITTLAETTGPYKGQKLFESPKTGMFILDVTCKGRWFIKRK